MVDASWFINELAVLGSATNVFTVMDVLTVLIVSTLLSFIAAKTYQKLLKTKINSRIL